MIYYQWLKLEQPVLRWTAVGQFERRGGGGEDGPEYEEGFAVYLCEENPGFFDLYTDDGKGNGEFIGSFETFEETDKAAFEFDKNPTF